MNKNSKNGFHLTPNEYRFGVERVHDGTEKIFRFKGKSLESCLKQLWNKISKDEWVLKNYLDPDGIVHEIND